MSTFQLERRSLDRVLRVLSYRGRNSYHGTLALDFKLLVWAWAWVIIQR